MHRLRAQIARQVQLHELGSLGCIFEMQTCRFQNIAPQLFPSFGLGKDRVAERTRHVAALFRLTYLEDKFHRQLG